MKKMTDRELTDKIGQVFDNFEDPDAGHGWRELRKKYPESDKRPLLLWWGAAAAALIVLCGLWFIVPETNLADQKIAEKKSQAEITNGQVSTENNGSEKTQAGVKNNPVSPSENTVVISQPKSSKYYTKRITKHSQERQSHGVIAPAQSFEKSALIAISSSVAPPILVTENALAENPILSLPQAATAVKNPEITRDSIIAAAARMLALAPQNSSSDNHAHRVEETPYSSRKTTTKNQSLSVYAGSYFNYSLGSETKLNFGAGFTSDIKLASNLRLSTGLGLAKNSLTYNNGVPSSTKAKSRYDAVPSFGISNGLANNSLTTVTKYNASLLALDIPINIKYLIIPKDNKLYLLAGLSSGTYLTETYSLDYRNYSPAGTYLNQGQGVETKNQLQAFDLARTLNISFGYSANLGKSQNITIEPFLKYPLGGLGSEDLRFGSTGLNLKLNFSKFKK